MKPGRIILLLISILPLVAACLALWIAVAWPQGTLFWGQHIRPYVAVFDDGRQLGVATGTWWSIQWSDGNLALVNHHADRVENQPYVAPAGFPYDPELARQIRREWDEQIQNEIRATPARGYRFFTSDLPDLSGNGNWWQRRGFYFDWAPNARPIGGTVRPVQRDIVRCVQFPAWVAVVLTGIPTVLVVRVITRRVTRYTTGKCLVCGYDLRASQTRCPECGSAIEKTTAAGDGTPIKPVA